MTAPVSPLPDSRPIPLVLDVDTGVDDAMALLFAAKHPGLDLRAVTCVAGNTDLDHVVANTLLVLQTAGRGEVPVAAGATRALIEDARPADHVHGADGMGDLGLSPATTTRDPRHAVELLRDTLRRAAADGEPVTVVALAPLTNLALLLRTHPDAAAGIGRFVFMGGGLRGNATAAAEFNIWHDPEAAAIVLDALADAGVPMTMYGLDVFYAPQIDHAGAAELRAHGTPAATLAAGIVEFGHRQYEAESTTIGDAGAVALLVEPDAVTTRHCPVRVELAGTWTRGQTVVDLRDWTGDLDHDPHGPARARMDVALSADGPRLARRWLDTVMS